MPARMTTSEEDVLEAFHAFYQLWARRQHRDDVDLLLRYCDETVTVIGTGTHEILVGIDAYRQLIIDDLTEVPGTLELDFVWSRAKVLGRAAVVEAEGELKVPIDDTLQSIGRLRWTHVYQRKEDRWVIEHVHLSFPSSDQTTDEVWPTEALKARNLELERQVVERTTALRQKTEALQQALRDLKATQAQLVQQEKLASLGSLTAGIAHEIKNPLNFVNNFSEITAELVAELAAEIDANPDKSVADLARDVNEILADLGTNAEQIAKHGKRADAIVRSMMQHASGGTGQREMTDVNALVSEYVDLAYHGKRAQVPGFTCDIEKDLGTGVGAVEMIPQEMGRVLLNLLGNAFDAVGELGEDGREKKEEGIGGSPMTPVGAVVNPAPPRRAVSVHLPSVHVSTRRLAEAVEIRIADNGRGIPEAIREKIFEPFFTTKPPGSGTGLGLSLSYDIVTLGHGGTLRVESKRGQGATFIVVLPHVGTVSARSSAG